MSALDPAILSNPSPDDDSDWEYEYHDTEIETFFLNLDLTTHNGPVRPPRRRTEPSASASTTTYPTSATPSRTDDHEPTMISSESDNASADRVQIMGLHTPNPIISYQNQIFSGSWADQIGTELFFARPGRANPELNPDSSPAQVTPLKHTKDFDFIAANSVKILGRKANLISSSGSGAAPEQLQRHQQQEEQPPSSSAPIFAADIPVYKPEHQSSQARFLKRLKDIKKQKGDTDNVRTVFSTFKRGPNLEERLRGWVRTEEQLDMIQQLNDRALQGDSEAIAELENLYAQLGSQDSGPSEGPPRSG
ncbi:TFIIIC subunit-domain-containing protein [Aspergillus cavernicola]|uniref:TFIIIC subunit-domain-containing protein n=1 Tax=Aspergillus cavernicola TaxID=176166 RepID=A0ABR4J2E5_9EURO